MFAGYIDKYVKRAASPQNLTPALESHPQRTAETAETRGSARARQGRSTYKLKLKLN
jgi:hypothetical protein